MRSLMKRAATPPQHMACKVGKGRRMRKREYKREANKSPIDLSPIPHHRLELRALKYPSIPRGRLQSDVIFFPRSRVVESVRVAQDENLRLEVPKSRWEISSIRTEVKEKIIV